jgi:hypothetical protein
MDDWETARNEGVPYLFVLPKGTELRKNEGPHLKGGWAVDQQAVIDKTFEPEVLQQPRLLVLHGFKADVMDRMGKKVLAAWEISIQQAEPMVLGIPKGVTVVNSPGEIQSCGVIIPKDGPPEIHIEMTETISRGGACRL